MGKDLKRGWFFAALAAVVALRLWYGACLIVNFYPDGAHDEMLQFVKALSVSAGEWMGGYSALALIKGCFYPLFAGTVFRLGLNYVQTLQLCWIAACLFSAAALRPLLRTRWYTLLYLAVMLFNPVSTSAASVTTYRDAINYQLALVCVSGFVGAALRYRETGARKLLYLGAGALFFGLCFVTREDAQWLAVFCAAALLLFCVFVAAQQGLAHKGRVIALALCIALPLAAAPALLISAKNEKEYGVFLAEDYNSGAFAAAYGALTRPYSERTDTNLLPIAQDVRQRLYPLCPSFAALAPYLEGESEASLWKWSFGGEDYGNGYVSYALRQAATEAGYYTDAPTAEAFWQRVADEVNAACDEGLIPARVGHRSGLASPFDTALLPKLVKTTLRAAQYAAQFQYVTPYLVYVDMDESYKDDIESVLHCRINAKYRDEQGGWHSMVDVESPGHTLIVYVNKGYSVLFGILLPVSVLLLALCSGWLLFSKAARGDPRRGALLQRQLIALGLLLLLLVRSAMLAYVELTGFDTLTRPAYMSCSDITALLFILVCAANTLACAALRREARAAKQ